MNILYKFSVFQSILSYLNLTCSRQVGNLKSHQADEDMLSPVDQFYLKLLDIPW